MRYLFDPAFFFSSVTNQIVLSHRVNRSKCRIFEGLFGHIYGTSSLCNPCKKYFKMIKYLKMSCYVVMHPFNAIPLLIFPV